MRQEPARSPRCRARLGNYTIVLHALRIVVIQQFDDGAGGRGRHRTRPKTTPGADRGSQQIFSSRTSHKEPGWLPFLVISSMVFAFGVAVAGTAVSTRRRRTASRPAVAAADHAGALGDVIAELRAEQDPRRAMIRASRGSSAPSALKGCHVTRTEAPLVKRWARATEGCSGAGALRRQAENKPIERHRYGGRHDRRAGEGTRPDRHARRAAHKLEGCDVEKVLTTSRAQSQSSPTCGFLLRRSCARAGAPRARARHLCASRSEVSAVPVRRDLAAPGSAPRHGIFRCSEPWNELAQFPGRIPELRARARFLHRAAQAFDLRSAYTSATGDRAGASRGTTTTASTAVTMCRSPSIRQ